MPQIVFKELSYKINGLLFKTHNFLGRFCREKQYSDYFIGLLDNEKISYIREKAIPNSVIGGNIPDVIIDNKIIIEFKAKQIVTKDDYYQLHRYLQDSGIKLGLLVNFRNKYLKPIRVIRAHS
ncbi:MAG: GxxExxY protein [Patescibacteria group bacterium]